MVKFKVGFGNFQSFFSEFGGDQVEVSDCGQFYIVTVSAPVSIQGIFNKYSVDPDRDVFVIKNELHGVAVAGVQTPQAVLSGSFNEADWCIRESEYRGWCLDSGVKSDLLPDGVIVIDSEIAIVFEGVTANGKFIGDILVVVGAGGLRVFNLSFSFRHGESEVAHPHCRDGRMCLGNLNQNINGAISSKDIATTRMLLHTFLSNFDADDAWGSIGRMFPNVGEVINV